MRPTYRLPIAFLLPWILSFAASASACLWDYDTLRDERRGLPGIAEVLAGKWERHSLFFYQQRVERMKAVIARDPNNLAAYDNLAVAHEKLGDQDAAIAVMLAKEKIKPGEYTTYANLGTFYLHKGDFDNGIAYIRKALEINPDAHFGREEYQLKLAEFLRDGKKNPRLLMEMNFLGIHDGKRLTPEEVAEFAAHPASAPATRATGEGDDSYKSPPYWAMSGSPNKLKELGLKDNVFDGIVGMIRFGTGTSAELYLTLGDLLALRGDKNLAYRAYQRAVDLNHPRQEYLKKVMETIREHSYNTNDVEPQAIRAEREAAESWVKAYQEYEDNLLRAGKDVEDEANYAAFYKQHGPAHVPESLSPWDLLPRGPDRSIVILLLIALGVVAVICVVLLVRVVRWVKWRRRRRRNRTLVLPA